MIIRMLEKGAGKALPVWEVQRSGVQRSNPFFGQPYIPFLTMSVKKIHRLHGDSSVGRQGKVVQAVVWFFVQSGGGKKQRGNIV